MSQIIGGLLLLVVFGLGLLKLAEQGGWTEVFKALIFTISVSAVIVVGVVLLIIPWEMIIAIIGVE